MHTLQHCRRFAPRALAAAALHAPAAKLGVLHRPLSARATRGGFLLPSSLLFSNVARCLSTATGAEAAAAAATSAELDTTTTTTTTTTTSAHKRPLAPEEIETRISSHRPKRLQQLRWPCPGCGVKCANTRNLHFHMLRCAPDLISAQAWETVAHGTPEGDSTAQQLTAAAVEAEEQLRARAIQIAFRSGFSPVTGEPLKLGPEEVAEQLQLPVRRVAVMLKNAMKAVPLVADPEPLEVLYEDEDFLAVNKPPGFSTAPVHRWRGGSMVNRVVNYLGRPPYTVHRLDMNTSGVLLFVKSADVIAGIQKQFRERTAQKAYRAICVGVPGAARFSVDAPIDNHPEVKVARRVALGGLPALTDFRVLAASQERDLSGQGRPGALMDPGLQLQGSCLVHCKPHTGRTHQIRVHLQHAGHPIVGDEIYGLEVPWIQRQALHAAELEVQHPLTGAPLRIAAPLQHDMLELLSVMGLDPDAAQQ